MRVYTLAAFLLFTAGCEQDTFEAEEFRKHIVDAKEVVDDLDVEAKYKKSVAALNEIVTALSKRKISGGFFTKKYDLDEIILPLKKKHGELISWCVKNKFGVGVVSVEEATCDVVLAQAGIVNNSMVTEQ